MDRTSDTSVYAIRGLAHYAIRKNAGENINGEPEAETQEPRRASPPPASSLCYEHSPLEPHPSHIYPSVSHKGNTNVLNMQDIQRKTIGLVAQSILSAMIFTAFTSSISRNDAVTLYLAPIVFFGEYHHLICLCDTTCIDHPALCIVKDRKMRCVDVKFSPHGLFLT